MPVGAGVPLSIGNQLGGAAFSRAPEPLPLDGVAGQREDRMTERDDEAKLAELDRLLNDPEVRLDPDRVWTILAEISGKGAQVPVRA